MDARLASAGDRDGMAIACRRPPAHGIPHTARRNDDEGRSLRRKRYSCRCDRILGYRSVPFVQGICSRVTAAAVFKSELLCDRDALPRARPGHKMLNGRSTMQCRAVRAADHLTAVLSRIDGLAMGGVTPFTSN